MDKIERTRREFLALPIEERRKLLEEQVSDPEIRAYYCQLFEPSHMDLFYKEDDNALYIYADIDHTILIDTLSKLGPKPSGRLLTEKDIIQPRRTVGALDFTLTRLEVFRVCKEEGFLANQDAATASIKDAEIDELTIRYQQSVEAVRKLKEVQCQARIEALIEAYDDMLDGMGINSIDHFKVSDWKYVQEMKLQATHKGGE